jgi:hypothetical protein
MMADDASGNRAKLAMSGYVSRHPADDCAFDASLGLGCGGSERDAKHGNSKDQRLHGSSPQQNRSLLHKIEATIRHATIRSDAWAARAAHRDCDSSLPILQYCGTHKHDIRLMRIAPDDRDGKFGDRDEARPRANVTWRTRSMRPPPLAIRARACFEQRVKKPLAIRDRRRIERRVTASRMKRGGVNIVPVPVVRKIKN